MTTQGDAGDSTSPAGETRPDAPTPQPSKKQELAEVRKSISTTLRRYRRAEELAAQHFNRLSPLGAELVRLRSQELALLTGENAEEPTSAAHAAEVQVPPTAQEDDAGTSSTSPTADEPDYPLTPSPDTAVEPDAAPTPPSKETAEPQEPSGEAAAAPTPQPSPRRSFKERLRSGGGPI